MNRLYTYQDLGQRYNAHPKTVSRWYAKEPKFRPSHNTVRISEDVVLNFEAKHHLKPARN